MKLIAMLHTKHSLHPSDDKARTASRQLEMGGKRPLMTMVLQSIPFRMGHLNIETARRLLGTPRANR